MNAGDVSRINTDQYQYVRFTGSRTTKSVYKRHQQDKSSYKKHLAIADHHDNLIRSPQAR